MTLRSKAFLAAVVVALLFFLTSAFFLLVQFTKESAADVSLRRLMSQTFAVTINDAESNARKLLTQIKEQGQRPAGFDYITLQDSAIRLGADFVFVLDESGQPKWSFFQQQPGMSAERKIQLMATMFNQLRVIEQLKNGVAYFQQEPLYVLANILGDEHQKVVVGFYLQSLFARLHQDYGFKAQLAFDQRDSQFSINQHIRGEVKLPGLISSPVSVWIEDESFKVGNISPLLLLLMFIGMVLGVALWWLWRVNFVVRIQSIIDQAHEINVEQAYQKRIKIPGDDELNELVGHYNSVISTLEYSYNLMVKSNLITTELISKVQENTELGSVGNESVHQQEEDELKYSLDMVNRLSEAVEHEALELYFQPVFDASHDRVIQVESLCRWFDPEKGLVPPLDFLALAEKSGQMPGLAKQVIHQACQAINTFQGDFAVSVNISPSQFVQPNLFTVIGDAISKYGIRPSQLEFEIKEHTIARDLDKSSAIIQKIHDIGVGICIDDFGLSKFSLMYLQRLPVSKIKLSKSFVDRLEQNPKEAAFVDGIARFAQGLDVRVVAKGVQSESQLYALEKIQSLDCQGYALARPMPLDQFVDWLQSRQGAVVGK